MGFWIDFETWLFVQWPDKFMKKNAKKLNVTYFVHDFVQNSKICDKSQDMITKDADADETN